MGQDHDQEEWNQDRDQEEWDQDRDQEEWDQDRDQEEWDQDCDCDRDRNRDRGQLYVTHVSCSVSQWCSSASCSGRSDRPASTERL